MRFWFWKKKKPLRVCRVCGEEKKKMALVYDDKEGLCHPCWEWFLPLALERLV